MTPRCSVCGDREAGVTPKRGVMRKHTVGIDRICRGSGKPPEPETRPASQEDLAELAHASADLAVACVDLTIAVIS